MRRISICFVLALFLLGAGVETLQRIPKTVDECAKPLVFGDRVLLTKSRFFLSSPKQGQYEFRDLYLIIQNATHPLHKKLASYVYKTGLNPVELFIEHDLMDANPYGSFFLSGLLVSEREGILELTVKPQKEENFSPIIVGLVTNNPCIIRDISPYVDSRVRVVLQTSTGT
jgi:hypothetical protein